MKKYNREKNLEVRVLKMKFDASEIKRGLRKRHRTKLLGQIMMLLGILLVVSHERNSVSFNMLPCLYFVIGLIIVLNNNTRKIENELFEFEKLIAKQEISILRQKAVKEDVS